MKNELEQIAKQYGIKPMILSPDNDVAFDELQAATSKLLRRIARVLRHRNRTYSKLIKKQHNGIEVKGRNNHVKK